MNRVLVSAAVAVGAFVSIVVLLTRLRAGGSILDVGDSWRVLYQGDTACVTLAAVIAVIGASVLRDRTVAVLVGGTGLLLLGVVALIGTSATWSGYSDGVATGLLIAAVAYLAANSGDRRLLQAWLIAGALAGALSARPLEQYRPQMEYSGDYMPVGTPPDWPLVVGAGVVLLLLAAVWFTAPWRGRPDGSDSRTAAPAMDRTMAFGIVIPVAALLLWWRFVAAEVFGSDDGTGVTTWPYGVLLVPVIVAGVLWLPGRDGLVLVAILATMSAAVTVPKWQGAWPMLLVFIALIVGGMLTGLRRPHAMIAMGVLMGCALITALDQSPWDAGGIIAAFVVPAAGAHVIAACLPTTAVVSTLAVAAPATLFSVTGITVGWVAYSSGSSPSGFDSFKPNTTELVLSVVTVAACAAVVAYVTNRRPPVDENASRL